MDIKFWPFAFYHVLRIRNVIPGAGQTALPLFLSTGRKDNFKNLRVFGCRVIVPPLGSTKARFAKKAKKGIFLGYIQNTTRLMYWFDLKSQRVKVGTHMQFDEGFNDLPLTDLPLGASQYVRLNHGIRPPPDDKPVTQSDLQFFVYPFEDRQFATIPVLPNDKHKRFGLTLADDDLMNRTYVKQIKDKSSAYEALPATRRSDLRNAFVTHINGDRVFSTEQANKKLDSLYKAYVKEREQGVEAGDFKFHIIFAPELNLTGNKLRKVMDNFQGFKYGTTKRIKSKPDPTEIIDDGTARFPFKTKVYKTWDNVEYKGEVQGYDPKYKTYRIVYEDGDEEDMHHNEVKDCSKGWRLPKKRRWKRKRNAIVTNYINKLAPSERIYDEYVHTFSLDDIRNIASI